MRRSSRDEAETARLERLGSNVMQFFIVSDQEMISTAGGDCTLAFHRADLLCFHPTDADCRPSILNGSIDRE